MFSSTPIRPGGWTAGRWRYERLQWRISGRRRIAARFPEKSGAGNGRPRGCAGGGAAIPVWILHYGNRTGPAQRHTTAARLAPVDVGRQLFVDDFLVERTDLERRFHKPSRHSSNPVLQPETRHEREAVGLEGDYRHVCYLGHGGVFHDPDEAV